MSEKRYLTREDVALRLNGTIIRYKNSFGYVRSADSGLNISFAPFDERGRAQPAFYLDANDPDLIISSPELGYVQVSNTSAAYATRAPVRRQRQGLASENISLWPLNGDPLRGSGDFLTEPSFLRMLYNKYPSKKELLNSIAKGDRDGFYDMSFGLSKNFALRWIKGEPLRLFRTNTPVGTINAELNLITLDDFWKGDSILIEAINTELKEVYDANSNR